MARNILVVEDDRNISDLIRMYLEKEGFEVRSAYDGGKAIEEYDKQAPDMVLLDIMLPVVDGWGVCAHIRVISWASWQMQKYPELKWLHHIPNGGSRNRAEAIKLKQMGVKSGVSDLCLPYPKGIYCGLYIEMKYDKGRHQPSQKEFLTDMAAAGHYVATCYTARDAVEVLEKYLNLKRLQTHIHVSDSDTAVTETAERMKEPNNSAWKDGEVKPLKV